MELKIAGPGNERVLFIAKDFLLLADVVRARYDPADEKQAKNLAFSPG